MMTEDELKKYYLEVSELIEDYLKHINNPNVNAEHKIYYTKKLLPLEIELSTISRILYPY